MSVGKISELVDESALAQLDQLYQKLGITTQGMIDATAAAAKFNNEIGGVKTLTAFTTASEQAIAAMQGVKEAQVQVNTVQQQAATETQKLVDQTKARALADADAAKVLQQVGGSLEQNIKLLIEQKLELANVVQQQKQLQNTVVSSNAAQQAQINTQAKLLQQELELKNANQSLSQQIKQQIKDAQAASGSNEQLNTRLAALRKTYDGLSQSERDNAQIGGVLLKNIQDLDAKTKVAAESQGIYNKSVGDYENAIKSAISQYVPFGSQLVQATETFKSVTSASNETGFSLRSLGTLFAGFSVAAFVTAIAAAAYALSQFRSGQEKIQMGMGILKQQFLELGEVVTGRKSISEFSLGDSAKTGIAIENLKIRAKYENEVTETIVKQQQAEADQLTAEARNMMLTKQQREQKAKDAMAIEDQILDRLKTNADLQVKLALDVAERTGKLLPATRRNLETGQGDISEANYLAEQGVINKEGYEMYKAALDKRTEALQFATMKRIKEENVAARNEMKILKELNTDELELLKARLEGEKLNAKLILDDNKQSYDARLAALKVYTDRSKQLVGVQNQIANAAPQITGFKKRANNQRAANEDKQVDVFDLAERQKIQKEAIEEFKKQIHELNTEVTDDLKESLNQQHITIEKDTAYKIDVLTDQFTQQKITVEKYNREIKIIQDKANEEKIQAEIDTYKQILGIQVAFEAAVATTGLPLSVATPQQIQGTKDKIATGQTALTKAKTQTKIDSAKDQDKDQKDALKDYEKGIEYLQQVQDDVSKLVQANYENEIALLEKRKSLIQETADYEVKRVNDSILSSKEKAREEAIIREQQKQQELQVDAQIAKIKERQAKYDRAAAIVNIVENTAVGIMKAIGQGGIFGIPFTAIIGALGAAQLAATIATPLPKFEKGGTVKHDGHIITGESGTELRIDPSGAMSLTAPYENVTYAKAGTKIISNKELQRIVGRPEPIYYIGQTAIDNRKVEKLLQENNELQKRQKRPVVNVQVDRWGAYSQQRNY